MVSSKVEAETNRKKKGSQETTTRGEISGLDTNIWGFMKKEFKLTDNDLINMKQAKIPAKINGMPASLYRFFNEDNAKAKGLDIKDYESLTAYSDQVLYEGYRSRGKDGQISFKKNNNGSVSFLEDKINKGEISEVGTIIPLTGGQKFLRGFGHFLMMGGFLVVIIVIVAIVILISMLTN